MDRDYTLRYLQHTPRYQKWQHALHPVRVYPDPVYPTYATIVEIPFTLAFPCKAVTWHTSRLSHRLPIYRSDHLEFVAVLEIAGGRKSIQILFVGEQVFQIWEKWLYFADPNGINLLQWYYQRNPHPKLPPASPDARLINYERGCIFARHPNLTAVMTGLTVG